MEMIGAYNVDYAGEIYDGPKKYNMVIISQFNGNDEICRKVFYFRGEAPWLVLETGAAVAEVMKFPNHCKLRAIVPTVTPIISKEV